MPRRQPRNTLTEYQIPNTQFPKAAKIGELPALAKKSNEIQMAGIKQPPPSIFATFAPPFSIFFLKMR
jgi:hypothetical protein